MAYLPLEDFGNPKTFTAYAREDITAGDIVFCSGADNVVNVSGATSFVSTDILVAGEASGAQINGVAVEDASSGGKVTIQTQGLVILPANATVVAGFPLVTDGANAVLPAGSITLVSGFASTMGRALTSAASGGYCVVNLNL